MGTEHVQLLTAADVGRLLHLHEQTIKQLARRGEIQSLKLGYRSLRFTREAVAEFIALRSVQSP